MVKSVNMKKRKPSFEEQLKKQLLEKSEKELNLVNDLFSMTLKLTNLQKTASIYCKSCNIDFTNDVKFNTAKFNRIIQRTILKFVETGELGKIKSPILQKQLTKVILNSNFAKICKYMEHLI